MLGPASRKRLLCLIGAALLLIVVLFNVFSLSAAHYQEDIEYYIPGSEETVRKMMEWPRLVKAAQVHNQISIDPDSFDVLYFKNCWNDENWFRMYADSYCVFLWMKYLQHSEVKSIDNVLSVVTAMERKLGEDAKSNQNGGMRCAFHNVTKVVGVKGYWKPCDSHHLSGNNENHQAEIIAFHIDQILAFYRTPPVIPKRFSETEFRTLAREAAWREDNPDPLAMYKVQTVMDKCGSREGADGAMVGWANFPIGIAIGKLKKERVVDMFRLKRDELDVMLQNEFNFTRHSPVSQITWGLENIAVNMFTILVGNTQKFGHSIFIARRDPGLRSEHGPLLLIDNDRSTWERDIFKRKIVKHSHPLGKICKFPLETSLRILAFNHTSSFTLGELIAESVSVYDTQYPLFTPNNVYYLNQRVDYLRRVIEKCIDRNGLENTLIPEPWLKPFTTIQYWSEFLTNVQN